jgi:uncharacterized protein YjbI with pentapeptide repeats
MDPVVESGLISAAATVLGVGGTVAVAFLGFRNARLANQDALATARDTNKATLDTTREGQLADRYSRAIEQLGSDTIDVTIGGIYALERIARDSAIYHPTIVEVLSARIREHSPEQWPKPDPDGTTHGRSTRPDIQAALTVLGRRDSERDDRPIDLTGADLTGARIVGKLVSVVLSHAKLIGADFTVSDLASVIRPASDHYGGDLTGAILFTAEVGAAYFERADLTGADLTRADLTGADLTGASLVFALLARSRLTNAVLTNANLALADLRLAELGAAKLGGANLTGANLIGARLPGARLPGADLRGATLSDTRFPGADLTSVKWPADTPVPEGWKLDADSGRLERADTESGAATTN